MIKELNSLEGFMLLKKQSSQGAVFLLKHSLTCPASAKAINDFEKFSAKHNIPCYVLKIQEVKSVSNRVELDTGIKHESPQAFLFKNGKVVWHASHAAVSLAALENAFRSN